MKQDQEVAVEVSNRVMKIIPNGFTNRSTTDLSQTISRSHSLAKRTSSRRAPTSIPCRLPTGASRIKY